MSEIKTITNSAAKMGEMPMFKLIMSMSLPSMFSMLVQACYNIVDSIYVSRLGEYALSAVSVVYPIQLFNIAVGVGTSVGLSSLISRRLGEKNAKDAQSAADHGLLLCIFHWLIFLLFGIFGSRWFCGLYAKTDITFESAVSYCSIICIGSFFAMTASSYEKIMQAGGNMMAPMWCMLSGAVTNILLDPVMIFGYLGCPAFGVAGAAYATVTGQAVTFITANLFMLLKKDMPVKIIYKPFKVRLKTIKDIYQVGFPTMVMQSITSVTTLVLNAILISFSETAVAVLGVYFKLQSFVFMPILGMNHGLLPIMGYNFGAKYKDRLLQALKYGMLIAFCIMVIGTIIFKAFPVQLMQMFDAADELLEVGVKCLATISWCFPAAGVCMIIGTMFQATAHGFNSLIVSVCRQLLIIIPLAWIFSKIWGLMGIWWSYPCAEIISLCITLLLYKRLYDKEIKNL